VVHRLAARGVRLELGSKLALLALVPMLAFMAFPVATVRADGGGVTMFVHCNSPTGGPQSGASIAYGTYSIIVLCSSGHEIHKMICLSSVATPTKFKATVFAGGEYAPTTPAFSDGRILLRKLTEIVALEVR